MLYKNRLHTARQRAGICQQTRGFTGAAELRMCDFSKLRFALFCAPPCKSPIHDPNAKPFCMHRVSSPTKGDLLLNSQIKAWGERHYFRREVKGLEVIL